MVEILGFDLSEHRKNIKPAEFDLIMAAGGRFMFTRVSRGYKYVDPTAKQYLAYAYERGFVKGGYHFFTPTGGVDPAIDGEHQAELYLSNLPSRFLLEAHFLDAEVGGIKWPHVIGFVERIRREGLKVGFYSRQAWWTARFKEKPDIFDFYWWAYYTKSRTLDDWKTPVDERSDRPGLLWQYGFLKYKWNSKKRVIDGNVFNGKRSNLITYLGA